MSNVTILKTSIRENNGLFSLNDLHIASGGESKHRPNQFLRLDQTKELIAEMENENQPRNTILVVKNGMGSYACEELVLSYAMWISPKFHLVVLRAFLAMHKGEVKQQQLALPEPENNELLQLLMRIYCYGLQYSDYQRAVLGTSLNDEVGKGKLIGDFCTEGEPAQQGYLFVFTPNIEKDLQQAREIINRHVKAQHKKRTEF
ncbi:KilA-N domain-containing protein [Avibacterium paragallinarum]|uniref:KilA domain-containing protein n=4 Tax=Avibacterium paragallinarum TaxID=728 RepID=A0A377I8X6_AVIPA|nr:KilA-N domain-containing protein [Avibacterium paragallinarum]RZN74040.1 KilA-N domain-containing protein [Avibacterium paragallinarum]CDF99139.1 Putative Kil A-N domain [Avibacterium paragallinarum JF4211]STO71828.1 KilA domain-containing protein [Avibacterium paragallinarum]